MSSKPLKKNFDAQWKTIDILNLKVWQQGEVTWFTMEIDYNHEVQTAWWTVQENMAIARYGSPESSRWDVGAG